MDDVKRPSGEWCRIFGFKMISPDGWRAAGRTCVRGSYSSRVQSNGFRFYNRNEASIMIKSDEVVFSSEKDALEVLKSLRSLLEMYEIVMVADLLELSAIPSTYEDSRMGWTDLTNVQTKQVENGFVLDLPQAKSL